MDQKLRERILLGAAIGLVVVLLGGTALSKVVSMGSDLEDSVVQAEADLRKMRLLVRDLTTLSAKTADLQRVLARPRFALLSHLDTVASRTGLPRPNMKPRHVTPSEFYAEESVEVKFEKLTLKQFVDFLYAVEASRRHRMRVTYLDSKARFDDPGLLNVTLHVSTYFAPDAPLSLGATPATPPAAAKPQAAPAPTPPAARKQPARAQAPRLLPKRMNKAGKAGGANTGGGQ